MELRNLITLKLIVETGSFQKAAHQLNYAQSTVTTQIQQLEKDLNVKLFEKIGRKMKLTQVGIELLPTINQIIETVTYLEDYAQKNNSLTGDLRIAIPETLLTYQVQPILKIFHEKAPNVKLFLKTLNCFDIPKEVEQGNVDLGIHYDVLNKKDNIISKKIWSHSIAVVGSSESDHSKIDLSLNNQTIDYCLLTNDNDSIYQRKFDEMTQQNNITFNHRIETGSIETIKRSVISNLGIAVLPLFVVEEEISKNTIQEIPSKINHQKIDTIYSYHKNKWLSPSLTYLIELLSSVPS